MSDQTGNPDGQITFADSFKPQLEAGKYELTATQTLTVMESLADLLGLNAASAPSTGQIAQILNGQRADGSALLEPTPGAAREQFLVSVWRAVDAAGDAAGAGEYRSGIAGRWQ